MSTQEWAPEMATGPEILRRYRRAIRFHLFTNEVQMSAPRRLSDYQEPTFPGYVPSSPLGWEERELPPSRGGFRLETVARWQLAAAITPVIIRGWFATVIFADGVLCHLTEKQHETPQTVSKAGTVILATITLDCTGDVLLTW